MSSFMPMPSQTIWWKCPKCGKETVTYKRPNPWILTCIPLFSGSSRPPVCSKCGIKMIKKEVWMV